MSTLVYFSFCTLTTVGYGDVTAVDTFARSVAMLEALTGQLFPAVLIARIVSMEVTDTDAKINEALSAEVQD
jgi:voltage-gated potassium channel Kch